MTGIARCPFDGTRLAVWHRGPDSLRNGGRCPQCDARFDSIAVAPTLRGGNSHPIGLIDLALVALSAAAAAALAVVVRLVR